MEARRSDWTMIVGITQLPSPSTALSKTVQCFASYQLDVVVSFEGRGLSFFTRAPIVHRVEDLTMTPYCMATLPPTFVSVVG